MFAYINKMSHGSVLAILLKACLFVAVEASRVLFPREWEEVRHWQFNAFVYLVLAFVCSGRVRGWCAGFFVCGCELAHTALVRELELERAKKLGMSEDLDAGEKEGLRLRSLLKTTEETLDWFRGLVDDLARDGRGYRDQITALRNELAAAFGENQRLRKALQDLENKTQKELAEKILEIQELADKVKKEQAGRLKAQKVPDDIKAENARLKKENEAVCRYYKLAMDFGDGLEEKLADKEAELAEKAVELAGEELTKAKKSLRISKQLNKKATKENAELVNKITKLEAEKEDAETKLLFELARLQKDHLKKANATEAKVKKLQDTNRKLKQNTPVKSPKESPKEPTKTTWAAGDAFPEFTLPSDEEDFEKEIGGTMEVDNKATLQEFDGNVDDDRMQID